MKRTLETSLRLLVLCTALAALNARAIVVSLYQAGTNNAPTAPDPTSDAGGGWLIIPPTTDLGNFDWRGLSPDPSTNNPGLVNAWRTLDNSTSNNVFIYYGQMLTPLQITCAKLFGWNATVYVRSVDPGGGSDSVCFIFGYFDNTFRYPVFFTQTATNTLRVYFQTGSGGAGQNYIVTNTTQALGYNLLQLGYNPSSQIATGYVNGVMAATNWAGRSGNPSGTTHVQWGTQSSAGKGDGYFNLVKFDIEGGLPLGVVQSPQNTTNSVGDSVTFAATFTNVPAVVQWYKDSSPIAGATTYTIVTNGPQAPGAISTYQIPFVVVGSEGSYYCQAANLATTTNTQTAHLHVRPDTTPPSVLSNSASIFASRVRLHFSEPLEPSSAGNLANYVFQGTSIAAASATVVDLFTVDIGTTPAPVSGSNYTLLVSGVQDQSLNTIPANTPVPIHVVSGFPVITNLIAAFDGSSMVPYPVSGAVWLDVSGNENHALNNTNTPTCRPALKPKGLGDYNTLLFDRAFQQFLQIDGPTGTGQGANAYTWFFVVKPTTMQSGPNVFRHASSLNTANWGSFFSTNNAKSGFLPGLFANGRTIAGGAVETPAYPIQVGQWMIGEGMVNGNIDNGGTSLAYSRAEYPLSNLVLSGTTNYSSTLAVGTPLLTYVGNLSGLASGFDGQMEALLLYNGALDDGQRAQVESYLRTKYFAGISLQRSGSNLQISYFGVLQSSTNAATGYVDVPGNPSNPYVITPGSQLTQQFFRARTP